MAGTLKGDAQVSQGTRSKDYSTTHQDGQRPSSRTAAARLVAISGGPRILDVGCGEGLLVQALRAEGAEARGFDVSEHAVGSADPGVREHLWVASAVDPLEGTYDLVTCLDVIEHLAPAEARRAIENITAVTDRVVLSSSPGDDGATRASWFAERGFFRRTDVDLASLARGAVLLERAELSASELVHRYESELAARSSEQGPLVEKLEAEVLEARHALLVNRDHVVGTEAQVGRLNREVMRLTHDLRRSKQRVAHLEKRRTALGRRVEQLRKDLAAARARNRELHARVTSLESSSASDRSLAARVVRRVRGAGR